MHSKSEMKRLGHLDPQKVADEYMKLKAERDKYKAALEMAREWIADFHKDIRVTASGNVVLCEIDKAIGKGRGHD